MSFLDALERQRVLPVLRCADAGDAVATARAVIAGGLEIVDTNDYTCVVRGRVLVRVDFPERAGERVGTQLDVGIEGRRNLLARIAVRPARVTLRMARVCS